MADFEIKITDNTGEVLAALEKNTHLALEAVGMHAENHAKQVISNTLVYGGVNLVAIGEKDNSRVDTGQLRNSIAHTVVKNEAYIGTNIPYAAYHELGTGIHATQAGGRKTPWKYKDRKGKWHVTRGLYPIHFIKKAASEHTDEYKKLIETIMRGK